MKRIPINDFIGKRYGRLTVLKQLPSIKKGTDVRRVVLCLCDCGNEKEKKIKELENGSTKSCGCLHSDRAKVFNKKHGGCNTSEYRSWQGLKSRVFNKKNKKYPNYGGRGIVICDRWKDSFENFLKDIGKKPTGKYTIGRIDNDGDYCPENCRWENDFQQAQNKTNNTKILYNGELKCIDTLARECGVERRKFRWRISKGLNIEQSITLSRSETKQFLASLRQRKP